MDPDRFLHSNEEPIEVMTVEEFFAYFRRKSSSSGKPPFDSNDEDLRPVESISTQTFIERYCTPEPTKDTPMITSVFKKDYKKLLGTLTKDSEDGLNTLLRELEADAEFKDAPAEVAYVLATVWHETFIPSIKQRFVPCTEQPPAGSRRLTHLTDAYFEEKYGLALVKDANGAPKLDKAGKRIYESTKKSKTLGNVNPGDGEQFRGRGYVQVTGRDNYARIGKAIGDGDFLVKCPWAAAVNPYAYKILAIGMRNGIFTGKKLGDYRKKSGGYDFVGARAIVNGKDKAELIAGHAEAVYQLLLKGIRREEAA